MPSGSSPFRFHRFYYHLHCLELATAFAHETFYNEHVDRVVLLRGLLLEVGDCDCGCSFGVIWRSAWRAGLSLRCASSSAVIAADHRPRRFPRLPYSLTVGLRGVGRAGDHLLDIGVRVLDVPSPNWSLPVSREIDWFRLDGFPIPAPRGHASRPAATPSMRCVQRVALGRCRPRWVTFTRPGARRCARRPRSATRIPSYYMWRSSPVFAAVPRVGSSKRSIVDAGTPHWL